MSDKAPTLSTGASEASAVGLDAWRSEAHGWGSQGLCAPLSTTTQSLREPSFFLWARGIPEPCI